VRERGGGSRKEIGESTDGEGEYARGRKGGDDGGGYELRGNEWKEMKKGEGGRGGRGGSEVGN